MKFAHIADIHLGREQFQQPFRYRDYVNAFRQTIEKAIKENVDFILIAGDFFHVSKPSPKAIRDAIEILSLAKKKDIPVFAIEGNHDKTIRETSIYDLLEHLGLIYTVGIKRTPRNNEFQKSIKRGNVYLVYGTVGDIEIYGLKHHNRWQLIRRRQSILKNLFKGKPNAILMLHQAIDYLAQGTPYQEAFDLRLSEIPDGFPYYAMGHIHVRKELKKEESGFTGDIVYPGSPERTEIREASHRIIYDKKINVKKLEQNIKGFYLVEDFEPEFIEIETRPFYNVVIKGNSKQELKKKLQEVRTYLKKDSIAMITLEGTIKGGIHISEFYSLLADWNLAYYNFNNRVTSGVITIDTTTNEEDFFTEFERGIFEQLRLDPKDFISQIDEFIEWLMERYTEPKKTKKVGIQIEESKIAQKEEEKNIQKTKQKIKNKPKTPGKLDAWLKIG